MSNIRYEFLKTSIMFFIEFHNCSNPHEVSSDLIHFSKTYIEFLISISIKYNNYELSVLVYLF